MSQDMTSPLSLAHLEKLVSNGQSRDVFLALSSLSYSRIPRESRLGFADLARRISQPAIALKVLYPCIYPSAGLKSDASSAETLCYVGALRILGILAEAKTLLSKLSAEENPQVLFESALIDFTEWNYAKAIPLLKQYVMASGLTDYRRFVGKVNLVAAKLGDMRFAGLIDEIDLLIEVAIQNNYKLLQGNLLELRAQIEIQRLRDIPKARQTLVQAEECLRNFGGIYLMFVQKWHLGCDLLEQGFSEPNRLRLKQLRVQATRDRFWEILRDIDFLVLMAQKQWNLKYQELAAHLIWGSPYFSYRKRISIMVLNGQRVALKRTYSRCFDKSSDLTRGEQTVDLFALLSQRERSLHVLLWKLSEDFYKPVSLGALFETLFPGEVFLPESSPKRVQNLVLRLRKRIAHSGFRVEVLAGSFRLTGNDNLLCKRRLESLQLERLEFFKVKTKMSSKKWSADEMAHVLGLSRNTIYGLIKWALFHQKISSVGKGPARRYQFESIRDDSSDAAEKPQRSCSAL